MLVADLGIDKVLKYKFDPSGGDLTLEKEPAYQAKAGAGPRHLCFHHNKKNAYLLNELDSTLIVFEYNESTGDLKEI